MPDLLELNVDRIETPIGELLILVDAIGNLRAAGWAESESGILGRLRMHFGKSGVRLEPARNPHGLTDAIRSYFDGCLNAIDAISVEMAGTPFQREVWRELRQIPCGTTTSYAEVARRIGRPNAVRAVGLANGFNPIPIVVPCHRVIGSDGSLTGYGGGIDRKRWLLEHEKCTGAVAQRDLPYAHTSSDPLRNL